MTVLGDYEYVTSCLNMFQHSGELSENVKLRHSELDSESRCSFQRSACLSKREAALLGERGTTQRLTSFSCSYEPPTRYPRPRFLVSPDPGSSPG